jgi:hypothetical protein
MRPSQTLQFGLESARLNQCGFSRFDRLLSSLFGGQRWRDLFTQSRDIDFAQGQAGFQLANQQSNTQLVHLVHQKIDYSARRWDSRSWPTPMVLRLS